MFSSTIGMLTMFLTTKAMGSNSKDYTIELDKDYGVIINNDTIELENLEEYIILNNI